MAVSVPCYKAQLLARTSSTFWNPYWLETQVSYVHRSYQRLCHHAFRLSLMLCTIHIWPPQW